MTVDVQTRGAPAVSTRTTCRSCDSPHLRFVLSLGTHCVSTFVDGATPFTPLRAPLELVVCDAAAGGCGLLQLRHTVAVDLLYRNYWYRSMVNSTMVRALEDICRAAEATVPLRAGDLVLDIGCNDGTLLRAYTTPGLRRVGFEPARNLFGDAAVGTTEIIGDFFSFDAFARSFPDTRARVITSIAMFYDLEEPNAFVDGVARCLDREGVWIIQMSYLPSMLVQNAFDNICHEHLEYYALRSVQPLLERHGLRVVDATLNDVNGGSVRLFVRHRAGPGPSPEAAQRVAALEAAEAALRLETRAPYEVFASRVLAIRDRLVAFIAGETARGKTTYAYGASTKGNTLLQFCGLDHTLIRAAADRNPDKWGKRTVGTLIPIVSEAEARVERPDYFLILPWHFLEEFTHRERPFLERGGRFIVPLPEFRVLDGAGREP
jgi:SAM-dependent methyltransferase